MVIGPNLLAKFMRCLKGGVALISALSAVPLMLGIGVALDFAKGTRYREMGQAATDAASLAAALTTESFDKALNKLLTGDDARKDAAEKMLELNLPIEIKQLPHQSKITLGNKTVKVDLTVAMKTSFMRIAGIDKVNVGMSSTAQRNDFRACLIALGAGGAGIHLGGNAKILAPDCWAYSNKTGPGSVSVGGSSKLTAAGICTVGTPSLADITSANPPPIKCPPLTDPLAAWVPPTTGWLCDHNNFKKQANAVNKTITLTPGVYCGGLKANGYDSVTLQKGIYFIKDGTLDITSKLSLTGLKIGFYLSKDVTGVTINGSAAVNLTADDEGPMAGLIIAMEPGASTITKATLNGTASLFLQGSIYLPTSDIALSGTSSTTLSPVTQVIGYSIDMQGTSDLTFNPDFEAAGYNVRGPDARVVLID